MSQPITVAEAIAINEPAAETVKVVPAVATFGFTAPTAEATPIEATPAKAATGPFANIKSEIRAEAAPAAASPAANAPRIMPPSDPMEQFLCDSCQ
jgi:hypothetical protein